MKRNHKQASEEQPARIKHVKRARTSVHDHTTTETHTNETVFSSSKIEFIIRTAERSRRRCRFFAHFQLIFYF